ncbi:restriction endonuclease subunit S [Vibrio artabrorum]|uniref:restriction endonuclease subunit S n=1 Tax=Vibrio artabrorum TaxID=446374 RepID=UPI003554483D
MNEEKLLQPRLRFLGFEELCWENKNLGEVVNFYSGLTYSPSNIVRRNGTLVLRSSNVQNGQLALEDNVYVESKVVNSNNVKVGDIVVVVRNGSKSLIGKHAQILTPMPNTVIGAFMTGIRTDQSNFVNALLDTPLFKKAVEKNLGATINQITTGVFKEMEFHFSSSDKEQTKIGNFFTNTDQQLILHQSKLTKLQQLKKAMLDKMFPKQGATVPEVRFSGFNKNWESKILGHDIADIIGGGTPNTMDNRYWDGDIDWYAPTEIGASPFACSSNKKITQLGLDNSSAKWLPADRTILFTSRAGIGDMAILKSRATTNQGFQSLVLKEGYNTYFVYSLGHLIKSYAMRNASGSTFLEISGKLLGKMEVKVPSVAEQTKIGEYFQSLDHLIALQEKQIKKLENIKQSFLEKMFV